ncbi:ADP-ribose glycohydrolase MACROD1-like [Ostrinia furnacalis]|uniref:ADP-ribose glycohydrolase MACROD1-like n=1 Tax=Ostrinia furnacalis TaxID=93504 RepID=UPI001040AE35|nr:ADP-ribose glycohydrolase MACROD1-like [Ostrinia furnacalis]
MILPANRAIFFSIFHVYRAQLVRPFCVEKMTTQSKWKVEKNKIANLPLEEKRKLYKPGDYIILDKVDPWCKFVIKNRDIEMLKHTLDDLTEFQKIKLDPSKDKELSEKVSIFQGDITKLEVYKIQSHVNCLFQCYC